MLVLGLAAIAAVMLMSLAWVVVRRLGDGGWTDVVWTFSVGLVGVGVALAPAAGAVPLRQMIVAALVGVWAARIRAMICSPSIEVGGWPSSQTHWPDTTGRTQSAPLAASVCSADLMAVCSMMRFAKGPMPIQNSTSRPKRGTKP